jgi:hypothetical protein
VIAAILLAIWFADDVILAMARLAKLAWSG